MHLDYLKQASNYNTEVLPSQKWKSKIQIFGLGREGPYFVKRNTLIRRTSTLKKTLSICSRL